MQNKLLGHFFFASMSINHRGSAGTAVLLECSLSTCLLSRRWLRWINSGFKVLLASLFSSLSYLYITVFSEGDRERERGEKERERERERERKRESFKIFKFLDWQHSFAAAEENHFAKQWNICATWFLNWECCWSINERSDISGKKWSSRVWTMMVELVADEPPIQCKTIYSYQCG